MPEDTDIQLRI